jgi:hypothetical protein
MMNLYFSRLPLSLSLTLFSEFLQDHLRSPVVRINKRSRHWITYALEVIKLYMAQSSFSIHFKAALKRDQIPSAAAESEPKAR